MVDRVTATGELSPVQVSNTHGVFKLSVFFRLMVFFRNEAASAVYTRALAAGCGVDAGLSAGGLPGASCCMASQHQLSEPTNHDREGGSRVWVSIC